MTVLACGCFDLLHAGHVAHLREARAMGDRLVVALTVDEAVGKGELRPVMPWADRAVVLAALPFVDQIVPSRSAAEAIMSIRPDVFVKGIDYRDAPERADVEACRAVGAEMRFTTAPKRSTTEILRRVRACG